jgi:hypothetical protein
MRVLTVVLLPLLSLLTGCAIQNRYFKDGPDAHPLTAYGLSHGIVTVPIVVISGTTTGKPLWGALASCAFYLGHETEETRNWSYFEWGSRDSVADVAVPCLTGFAMNRLLSGHTWWKLFGSGEKKSAAAPEG